MKEQWKPVVGCEHVLEVSNRGRFSEPFRASLLCRVMLHNPVFNVNKITGVHKLRIRVDGRYKGLCIASTVLEAFGFNGEGCKPLWDDGDKANNSLSNLSFQKASKTRTVAKNIWFDGRKYAVNVRLNGKNTYLGYFDSIGLAQMELDLFNAIQDGTAFDQDDLDLI